MLSGDNKGRRLFLYDIDAIVMHLWYTFVIMKEARRMIRILAVDDEKPIVELLRLSLSRAGCSCICAYDGIEAANLI